MEQDDEQPLLPQPTSAARKHHPPPPHLKCPRCDSNNTKFCYYNNYSLAQPRYFCKACRRYWTHGGTLRNVPVGGGCRKNKRPAKASPSSTNLPFPSLRPQNPTDHTSRLPPALGNSLYVVGGGGFTPPFAAMPPAAGGGRGQFGANLSLLQAVSFQSLKSQATNQFQHPPTNLFDAHQNSINSPIRPWGNQILKTAGMTSPSPAVSNLWGGGGDRVGSSLGASNQWATDNYPGFNPCHR